ncbi:esterase/lipase family protein [Leptospira sp. GIMC2001]|uniref:esterase/lipase family protein n=1 Tax=Leptospira sp. GIMC2001 TaxID=1513297 RepID=UPI00234B8281|nr:hypothetical protein [Leptospira sp. GIMC2001]WCL50587.1 hypothetical protein O4O04_07150 [Leptospira sp. GIMC2001]
MIPKIFQTLAIGPIGVIGETTMKTLEFTRDAISNSLHWSGESLEFVSSFLVFWEEGKRSMEETGQNLKKSSAETRQKIEGTIENTVALFKGTLENLKIWERTTDQLITQNRVLSSILGSSMDDKIRLTTIDMSFRDNNEDVSTENVVKRFMESGKKEIIVYVQGLFTDESLWKDRRIKLKNRKVLSRGLSEYLEKKNYFPVFLRYNHGLHISENGTKLLKLFRELHELLPDTKVHILSYSLGCLIMRSMLYQAKKANDRFLSNLGRVVHVASPDCGSYLEKLGFWAGFLMERTPITAVKIIGIVGNFRSDAIKDLSHGIIRREDWAATSPFFRHGKDYYFGELDGFDFYQSYAVFSLPDGPLLSWLGDGIVETKSLKYLSERVVNKLSNPESRVLEIHGANHFTILSSGKLFKWIDGIFEPLGNNS